MTASRTTAGNGSRAVPTSSARATTPPRRATAQHSSPGGTAIDAAPPPGAGIVCFVPGVAGDHGGYAGLRSALQEAGAADVREFAWGSPIFLFNFQSTSIHDAAENQLANRLADWVR